jgi:hypothetical protein
MKLTVTYWCSPLSLIKLCYFMMNDNGCLFTGMQELGNGMFVNSGGYMIFRMSYHYSHNST